jgi:3',5'-cyclic AMP phosphodiesterase CpdA
MARIAHLTDMHAGAADDRTVSALLESLKRHSPDVVVVGGDLTQRSRGSQWRTALEWLDALPCEWIATPGNHDIPLFDVGRRIASPFGRFRQYVGDDLEPSVSVAGAYVLCVRTATPKRRVEGAVERDSLKLARELLDGRSSHDPVVLVTHHPLVMHPNSRLTKTMVIRGQELVDVASAGGVDLLLSGHTHRPHGGEAFTFESGGRKLVAMHGGTACSTRTRADEPPAWQLVETQPGAMTLTSIGLSDGEYQPGARSTWLREEGSWRQASG